MNHKLFLSTLAAAVAVPAIVAPIQAEAATSFKDVPASYYTHKQIMDLVSRGVINGYSDGTFRPAKQVTRAEFAAFVARALELPAATSNFKDVPKTSALYDGVSRANKAGIIKGFANGLFKPNTPVNRQDMAVMVDRALQSKGAYTKTKKLDFTDTKKIGAYATTSVSRLYYYNVMTAFAGKNFNGTTIGTRAETAKVLYNMLTVIEGGKVTGPTPPAINKSYLEMTLAELKSTYPQYHHVIVYRQWRDPRTNKVDMKIIKNDMMEQYYNDLHTPVSQGGLKEYAKNYPPAQWFGEYVPGYKESFAAAYRDYPMREVISYNGKSYKDSAFMPSNFTTTNFSDYRNMPFQPEKPGQFKIDIHRYDDDFAIYRHEDVKTDVLGANPVEKSRVYPMGNEYVVDVSKALKYATGVTMARGGLEIAYNGNKIVLTNGSKEARLNGEKVMLKETVSVKGGAAYVPIREVVEKIGLYTRVSHISKRFEIANFPLEHKVGLWLE